MSRSTNEIAVEMLFTAIYEASTNPMYFLPNHETILSISEEIVRSTGAELNEFWFEPHTKWNEQKKTLTIHIHFNCRIGCDIFVNTYFITFTPVCTRLKYLPL